MDNASATQSEWEIGLSSWIIQDGNYDDFETAQAAEFALEFYSEIYQKSEVRAKSVKSLGVAKYKILGEVVYQTPEVWVLDFGICAFQNSEPPGWVNIGCFVSAEIHLGIDAFFYFEGLHGLPGMPPLIYSWKINSIGQQTAPLLLSSERVLVRDASKLGYKTIRKTDAWNDDDKNAEYILNCTRMDVLPKKRLQTQFRSK